MRLIVQNIMVLSCKIALPPLRHRGGEYSTELDRKIRLPFSSRHRFSHIRYSSRWKGRTCTVSRSDDLMWRYMLLCRQVAENRSRFDRHMARRLIRLVLLALLHDNPRRDAVHSVLLRLRAHWQSDQTDGRSHSGLHTLRYWSCSVFEWSISEWSERYRSVIGCRIFKHILAVMFGRITGPIWVNA